MPDELKQAPQMSMSKTDDNRLRVEKVVTTVETYSIEQLTAERDRLSAYIDKLSADLDDINSKIDAASGLGIEPAPVEIAPGLSESPIQEETKSL